MYSKPEAYRLFSKFEDEVEKIKVMYQNLKDDLNDMPLEQLRSSARKILSLLNKLDFNEVEQYLEALKGFADLPALRKTYEKISADVENMKHYLFSLVEKKKQEKAQVQKPYKKSKIEQIKSRYNFLKKEIDVMDIDVAIDDARSLEREVSRLDFAELPEGDYNEMIEIRNDLAKTIKIFQGVEKAEKYGPYLEAPLLKLVSEIIMNKEKAEKRTAGILDFIEDPERIEMFEPAIKRIIARKMTPKEFKQFYQTIMSTMGANESIDYSGMKLFETYESQNEIEEFVDDVIEGISESILNVIQKGHEEVIQKPIRDFNSDKYTELSEYLNETDGYVAVLPLESKGDEKRKIGVFIKETGDIIIKFPFDEILENIDADELTIGNIEAFFHDDSLIGISPRETLIHEVQHAFDNWRSKGKAFQSKQALKYQESPNKSDTAYLRLPHELSSRFTEAISKIDSGKLIPMTYFLEDFKKNFIGWDEMTPNIQKRLIRRASNFWQSKKENVKESVNFTSYLNYMKYDEA